MVDAAKTELDSGARLGYRSELDGLRAFAVIAVITSHYTSSWFGSGGYIGVDLFFVLSGFLITRLLLEEVKRTGSIHLKAFYVRRAARLFPALALVCVAVTIDALTVEWSGTARDSLVGVVSSIAYVGNWVVATGHTSTLGHTWSLAIEEQFYLVWPAVMLVIVRRGGIVWVRRAAAILAAVATVQTAVRFRYGIHRQLLIYGSDSRGLIALMSGCLLATMIPTGTALAAHWLGRLSRVTFLPALVVVTIIAVKSRESNSLYRYGGWAMLAAGFALIICRALQVGRLLNPLRMRPVVWVGKLSYGLYLWHFPIGHAVNKVLPAHSAWQRIPLAVVVTCLVASCSYYFVEAPVRTAVTNRFVRNNRRVTPAGEGVALAGLTGG